MSAPFFKYGLFGDEISLVVAFITGIAFGFFLERAGFGNARLLAAQFYFRDLRVLKVMFTAIVTAMVGLFLLSWLGWVDLSLVYLTPTFVAPQIVGGLVLGAGFIIGGYCPGTSCVSAATGRIDGMVFLAGMVGGLLGFAEAYPRVEAFAKSTSLGQVTLPQFFHLPYGLLVLAVVLMALAAFVAAEWAERRVGGQEPGPDSLTLHSRRLVPVRRLALVLLAGGLVAAVASNPYRGPVGRLEPRTLALAIAQGQNHVAAETVADWLIQGKNDFVLVDVRTPEAFARYHLPTAVNVPMTALTERLAGPAERLICYADTDAMAGEAAVLLRSLGYRASYVLSGGLEGWQRRVLFPAVPPPDATPAAQVDFARRVAVARHFGGHPQTEGPAAAPLLPEIPKLEEGAATPAATGAKPVAPKKKKEGC